MQGEVIGWMVFIVTVGFILSPFVAVYWDYQEEKAKLAHYKKRYVCKN